MGIRTISASVVAVAGVLVALGTAGCGSQPVPDNKIIDALQLKRDQQDSSYAIKGDPFCQVDLNLLSDGDEISQAEDNGGKGLIVTDSGGDFGVQAVPPFDPGCVKEARRGLDSLN